MNPIFNRATAMQESTRHLPATISTPITRPSGHYAKIYLAEAARTVRSVHSQRAERPAPIALSASPSCSKLNGAFTTRIAKTPEDFRAAARLINQQYASRNYGSDHEIPGGTTFLAEQDGKVIGTVTLVAKDTNVCELVRLASTARSTDLLPSLFSLAFQYGAATSTFRELRIEVTPRHALFYQAMLRFEPFGPEYINAEVNTLAQMMRIEVSTVQQMMAERPRRTLYAKFPLVTQIRLAA